MLRLFVEEKAEKRKGARAVDHYVTMMDADAKSCDAASLVRKCARMIPDGPCIYAY